MSAHRVLAVVFAFLIPATAQNPARKPASEPYSWKSVQMVGGGFVDGIIFHPTAKGVRYARTDMGGAYRWNPQTRRWEPLLDWVPYEDSNLMGVESLAVDASDPNRVYLACGTYTNANAPDGAILRSSDRGKTFARTNVPFKFGGNEDGRGNGERLAVDPNDGNLLFFGSRRDGMWKSADRGTTWQKVEGFPNIITTNQTPPAASSTATNSRPRFRGFGQQAVGIVSVVFDPASGKPGSPTPVLYAAASATGRSSTSAIRGTNVP